jgi:repressor LexA
MLTDRQQQIWNYLVEYVDRHGYPPTVREIGEEVGLASPSTVHAHLANLERAGLLRRDPTKPRALELIGRTREAELSVPAAPAGAVSLPLIGEIAAGAPLLAEQNVEEYLTFPGTTRADFLLRVRGDSMIEAGIFDGDLVIVRQTQEARNGEIVVALVGGDESADEATVKTFYREQSRIRLQPENAALEPIYADYVQVLGRVVGVFREL